MKTKEEKEQDFIKFLKDKKAKDGKLSKIGELFLSGETNELGLYVRPEDMKYILR